MARERERERESWLRELSEEPKGGFQMGPQEQNKNEPYFTDNLSVCV